ncbi:MAG TPA: hypothetical protein VNY51_13790 [Candidatus Dormibacteraeota bacterium]|jgi:hypothetical protein|nr:hypothetical protein [Candidatus Dormibacteraeota bacterium]
MINKRRLKGKPANKGKLAGILDTNVAFVILAVASMAVFDLWVFVGFVGR